MQEEPQKEPNKPEFKLKFYHKLAAAGLFFLELVKVVVLAAITIVLIRHFLFKPFYVRGASMEPNFYDKEYLIIDELSYRLREPDRGEVIVFRYQEDQKEYFLKRIIGLPGERIKVTEGKVIIYNNQYPEGKVLDESYYIDEDVKTLGNKIIALKNDEYFVLGDNRSNSYDSRRFGAVNEDHLVGRAFLRGWPFSRAQILDSPNFEI